MPDNLATFTNNAAPTSVTISNSTSINTIAFDAAAPAYSFTVQNGATFTINNQTRLPRRTSASAVARRWRSGTEASVEIGSLAGAGALQLGASDPNTLLFIAGSTSTTFSGVISGRRLLELDDAASLTVNRYGQRDRWRSRPLPLLDGLAHHRRRLADRQRLRPGVTVEGGTLSVINGGTLQVGDTTAANDLLVASNMIISGAGSSVTVNSFTGIGIFGPATLYHHQRRRAQ